MGRASDLRAFLGSGSLVRVLLPRQSATRTSSARVAILRLGLGSYRAKIQPGANRSLGRSPNRATAICGGYLWWGLIPCCGGSSIIRRNILGWRSSWHGDHSRWWPLRSPTRWPALPGHCWPAAATTERHGLRQRVSKKGWPTGGEVASVRSRTARGDEDVDAKRSRPSIGKPAADCGARAAVDDPAGGLSQQRVA